MAFSFDPNEPMDGKSRMALVRSKVERSRQNLRDMERRLDELHNNTPGTDRHIKARFTNTGEQIEYQISFDCLAAAGDVVNNLRGALDHLVYQLADAYTAHCPDNILEKTCFPITDNAATYKLLKKRIEPFIHPKAVELIDSANSDKGGHKALCLLNELNNISKHRMLLTVGETVYCYADWLTKTSLSPWFQYKIKNPHFFGIYAFPGKKDYVQTSDLTSIGQPNTRGGDALLPTLKNLIGLVDGILNPFLPYLEPANRRVPPRPF